MKYYIISGETSGDNHASRVISQLKKLDSQAQFRGMGGDQSEAAGQELLIHQKEMAIMGFVEILLSLRKISKNLTLVKNDIKNWKPDIALLVDYPGFNFKIAKYAHQLDIPVHYYISPKVWAWKEGRIKRIKKYVDELYCILPFEKQYFTEKGVHHTYVGNPSKETVNEFLSTNQIQRGNKRIALLPGSRSQEISAALPIMLDALKHFNEYEFWVAQAPGFDTDYYHQFDPNLKLIQNDMYSLLASCDAAIVTSGTATLEAALMNVPQVICYKANFISYLIAKTVLKLEYVSLVNLILGKAVITELLQYDFNPEKIQTELSLLLDNETRKKEIFSDYKSLQNLLGDEKPSKMVADSVWKATN